MSELTKPDLRGTSCFMANKKHHQSVVWNYEAILAAFGRDAQMIRQVLRDEGFPAPTLHTVYQWLRADRHYVSARWLPLVIYAGLKSRRLKLANVFAAPPNHASSQHQQNQHKEHENNAEDSKGQHDQERADSV